MSRFSLLAFISSIIVLVGLISIAQSAFATNWYVGQGLKQGDYYRYNLGWVQWENGAPVEIDFWVKNQTSNGLNLEMVTHDGSIIQKGIVTIGYVTPDPISYDSNMADYANYFKRTLGWLDAFATQVRPTDVLNPVYGRAGLFGEATIGSVGMQTVSVPAGTFKASAVYFRDSGVDSYIWVDPTLPFPVKAKVYAIKTSGAPTIGYQFDLLEHGNSQQPPSFLNIQSTGLLGSSTECPTPNFATDSVHESQTTDSASVTIEYLYSPSVPHQGCPMDWRIWFEPIYSSTQRISDIHYDIYTADDQGHEIGSLAQLLGRPDLYSSIGEDEETFIEKQPPPVVHYLINVAGTGPQSGITDVSQSGTINIDVKVAPPFSSPSSPSTTSGTIGGTSGITNMTSSIQSIVIPSWIKNTAKWWSQGSVDDSDFVKGVQYLIQDGIMKVPQTTTSSSGTHQIPVWVKNNAGWWADGQISDNDFVKGIQFLIGNGIIQISS